MTQIGIFLLSFQEKKCLNFALWSFRLEYSKTRSHQGRNSVTCIDLFFMQILSFRDLTTASHSAFRTVSETKQEFWDSSVGIETNVLQSDVNVTQMWT